MFYRQATESELETLWNRNIAENGNNKRWIDWKKSLLKITGQEKQQLF